MNYKPKNIGLEIVVALANSLYSFLKKLFKTKASLLVVSSIILASCSKDNNNNNPSNPSSATGSIQYKVNGSLVSMDNANLASGEGVAFAKQLKGIVPSTRYLLNAQKGANNILILTIVADSLHQQSYHYDSTTVTNAAAYTFDLAYNGQTSTLLYSTDYFDINISSYKNSRITGTFTARLTDIAGGLNATITEGVFNNIPVVY